MRKAFAFASVLLMAFGLAAQAGMAARIVIDPGHGGRDPGAIGVNGLQEKSVNLDIALRVRDLLEERGYEVLLTREDDREMDLQERVYFKEQNMADLFVSIHANANRSRSVRGTMVLYYDSRYPQSRYPASPQMAALTPLNRQLAQVLLEEVLGNAGTDNRGIVPSSVYVVRLGTMPSVLVETAFLSNPQDAALLQNPSFREAVAMGIANGIARFLPVGGFMDIAGHWAEEAIRRMKESGIVQGYRSRFDPDRPLSRAEFLAMADRLFRFASGGDLAGGSGRDAPYIPEQETSAEPDRVLADSPFQEPAEGSTREPADGPLREPAENPGREPVSGSDQHAENGGASGPSRETAPEEGLPENGDPASEEGADRSSGISFSDLSEDHWAFDILVRAADSGLLRGYPDGTIRPEAPITRAEVSALFDRVWGAGTPQDGADPGEDAWPFADVPQDSWYASSVLRLKTAGLIVGTAPKLFAPERQITRAEAAVLFDRFVAAASTLAHEPEGSDRAANSS